MATSPIPNTDAQAPEDPIFQALKGPLGKLIQDDVRLAVDPEKIAVYADLRKNELYYRGNQYLDEVWNSNGQLVDYRPINGQWFQENPDAQGGVYDAAINDVRGYGRKFIAVLAQSPPNVKSEPNDEQNEDHIRRAKKAQRLADTLHNLWNVKQQNRDLFLGYYKTGTQFGHTTFITDEEKYGYTEEPVMEMQPTPSGPSTLNCVGCGQQTPVENSAEGPMQCPCGMPFGPEDLKPPDMVNMPVQTGTRRYANGCVEHRVESGMRVTTSYDVRQLTDCPWLLLEFEQFKGKIFQAFPEMRGKFINEGGQAYGEGGTATTSGQITRDIASSPSGTYISPRKNRLLYSECWLRPTMYELARGNVILNGESVKLRDALKQQFPKGIKVTQVNGDTIVKLEEERMDDVWCMSPPEPAENAYPDPICKDYLPMQDLTNDLTNIQRQTWERAIPQTMFDTRRIDMNFQAKYRQLPGSFIPMLATAGGDIKDAIATVAVAKPEPEMERYAVEQREHGAEIIGITPQIYGGGGAEQTAYATNLKRNQAMLQLSMVADAARNYWADVTFNAVMLMAKYSKGKVPSPYAPTTESDTIEDLEELLQGGWHFEGGDAMPMSWPEQREQMNENLKNFAGNPQALNALGYMMPQNVDEMQDLLIGMPEWKLPNQDAYNKVFAEIRELLKSAPIEQPSQMNPGQMIQVPSIPVDDFEDDHGFVAQVIKDWAQTEKAMDVKKTNPQGYANVIAFAKAHAGLALPPPMPGGPPPGPGGPPQGGPPQQLMPPSGGDQAQGPPQ